MINWSDPHTYVLFVLAVLFFPAAIAYGTWRSHVRATTPAPITPKRRLP
jgi:hypothetical protein